MSRARGRSIVAGAVSATLGVAALAAACKGDGTYVFLGRLYLPARGCVATTSSVDVIDGEDPGTCAPVCLAQPRPDGGPAIYVSSMCAPYPFGFEVSGADPSCPAALAALGRDDTCISDGGSSHPLPALDAGADAPASD